MTTVLLELLQTLVSFQHLYRNAFKLLINVLIQTQCINLKESWWH
jgi:hypothetical protein